ncbi:MAG: hypothetical protein HC836_31870 [Richelia sp. RM2_1_2]|nr:hypothetical protein [Richelia sp. RM2_1_2]
MRLKEFRQRPFVDKCEEIVNKWHEEFLILLKEGKVLREDYDYYMNSKIEGFLDNDS